MSQKKTSPNTGQVSRRGLLLAAAAMGPVVGASATGLAVTALPDAPPLTRAPDAIANESARYVMKDALVFNVKDHGVVGDGMTDDTRAINALFARIGEGGPRRILFPPGRYMHTGVSLSHKSGFDILGPGELVAMTPTVTEYVRLDNCSNFRLLGLQSSHENPVARRTTPARAFSITNCSDFEVSGCHAHHGEGVGIMLHHSSRAALHGNRVHDTKADGIGLYGDTHHVTVTGNSTYETGDDGIAQVGITSEGVQPHDNAISGNTVGRSYARGIALVGAYNTTVAGNTVDTTRAAGIYVASESSRSTYGCANAVITGNVVKDANTYDAVIDQAAIFVFGDLEFVEDVTVADNRVLGARSEGIRVGGRAGNTRRINLMGNSVTTVGASGLALWSVEDVSVIGNAFTDMGSGGISATDGLRGAVVVTNNAVRNPNTSESSFAAIGIAADAKASIVVSANTITSSDSSTFGIDVPNHATIYGNNLNGAMVRGGANGTMELYGNLLVSAASTAADAAGGNGVLAVRNTSKAPVTNPRHGGILYVEDGALKYKGSTGTVTTLGPP